MKLTELPGDVLDRARSIARLAETDVNIAGDFITPWIRDNPDHAAQVLLALALMGDSEKALKAAHAAYTRGDLTPAVEEMERQYQRERKAANRKYTALRRA